MFLDWIAQLGLLHHDPVSNVLARFPLSVRKTLITEVTSTLLSTSDLSLLSSLAHMKWAMEVLGQGFALPLEELSIAQETTQLYSQWLFEPQLRPLAFREAAGTADEQVLYQTMFHHYSLLFQVRPSTGPPHPHRPGGTPSTHHQGNHHNHHNHHGNNSALHTPTPQVPIGVLIQRHIELCKKVLTVLTMAGRQLGNTFSEQTWEVLLKVILGITDSLLREQLTKPSKVLMPEHTKMSDDLCEHLLRVLFELWLRSNIRQVHMWDILKKCFNGWTHRIPVLHQWAASSLGLCQRVVRLLYGPGQGTDVVNLAVGGYNIGLDLQADFVLYAWHRVIYLLRSPSKLSPTNCLAAVNGIGRMVETFLLVGHTNQQSTIPGSPPLPSTPTDIFSSSSLLLSNHSSSPGTKSGATCKPTSPDGNTIMHMFGAWLFEISSLPTPDASHAYSHWNTFPHYDSYHEAQASAFGVLCRIFSKPQPSSRPFLRIYTERFYEALSIGLRSETSLPTILAHSTELFTSELEGVRMMVPDFVIGIRMAMSGQVRVSTGYMSQEKQQQILEDLHLAALKVAGCIMCLPNHFEKVELKDGWNVGLLKSADIAENKAGREDKEILSQLIRVLYTPEPTKDGTLPATKRFTTLKYYILEMLLNCLETETSSFNLRYLLHLIEVYVFEDVAFCPGLVGVVVKTIQEKIVTVQVPVEVALCAFDVLVGCAGLYEYVRRDSKSCARELVLALCRYVDALLSNHTLLSTTHSLVVRAYECMMQWILAGQWIVGDQDCHLAVISSISNGVHIVERVEEHEASVVPPKPQQEKRRWGTGATGNAMISAVGAPLSLGKPSSSSSGASKLFQVNNKYPGPIKILNQEFKRDKKNRSASSSISGTVKPSRPDLTVIQHAAEMAMIQFSNQLGNFPVWTDDIGPSRMSTLWNDLALNRKSLAQHVNHPSQGQGFLDHDYKHNGGESHGEPVGPVRYFLLDRRVIMGCCEVPSQSLDLSLSKNHFEDEHGNLVVMTMRDASGKNSWKVQMRPSNDRSAHVRNPQALKRNEEHRDSKFMTSADHDHSGNTDINTIASPKQQGSVSGHTPGAHHGAKVLAVEAAEEESIGLKSYVRPVLASSVEKPIEKEDAAKTAFGQGESRPDLRPHQLAKPAESNVLRILMAQMGYLTLENRHRIVPLNLSETLLNQLQTLDSIKERDCIGVSVYYAQSGDIDYGELIHGSPHQGISKDFSRFLDCLGWPIQIESHQGFLGGLNRENCQTTPYFADRSCEVIFHVPYLMKAYNSDSATATASAPLYDHRLVDQFRHVASLDQVAVIWVEDRERMVNLIPLIDQKAMVYILIHPLGGRNDVPSTTIGPPSSSSSSSSSSSTYTSPSMSPSSTSAGGLFWIRMVIHGSTAGSVRLAANPLMIGPLSDGMLVSRHALGHLVRNTAISADKACRLMADTFSEPSAVRARYIQEMLQMHQEETEGVSEFYRTIFAS